MESDLSARVRLIVSGRVQGVFFRATAANEAHRLSLSGFVRNLNDGSVEIVAEGERSKLESMIVWAHHGPPRARVDQVAIEWESYRGEFSDFESR